MERRRNGVMNKLKVLHLSFEIWVTESLRMPVNPHLLYH